MNKNNNPHHFSLQQKLPTPKIWHIELTASNHIDNISAWKKAIIFHIQATEKKNNDAFRKNIHDTLEATWSIIVKYSLQSASNHYDKNAVRDEMKYLNKTIKEFLSQSSCYNHLIYLTDSTDIQYLATEKTHLFNRIFKGKILSTLISHNPSRAWENLDKHDTKQSWRKNSHQIKSNDILHWFDQTFALLTKKINNADNNAFSNTYIFNRYDEQTNLILAQAELYALLNNVLLNKKNSHPRKI